MNPGSSPRKRLMASSSAPQPGGRKEEEGAFAFPNPITGAAMFLLDQHREQRQLLPPLQHPLSSDVESTSWYHQPTSGFASQVGGTSTQFAQIAPSATNLHPLDSILASQFTPASSAFNHICSDEVMHLQRLLTQSRAMQLATSLEDAVRVRRIKELETMQFRDALLSSQQRSAMVPDAAFLPLHRMHEDQSREQFVPGLASPTRQIHNVNSPSLSRTPKGKLKRPDLIGPRKLKSSSKATSFPLPSLKKEQAMLKAGKLMSYRQLWEQLKHSKLQREIFRRKLCAGHVSIVAEDQSVSKR